MTPALRAVLFVVALEGCSLRDLSYLKAGPDGSAADASSCPATGGLDGVVALSAYGEATCALRAGGEVVCWGDNGGGRLGKPSTTASEALPSRVIGSGAVAVATGGTHVCAALDGGSLVCWGLGSDGQLGRAQADFELHPEPAPVVVDGGALLRAAGPIAAGAAHTCAVEPGGGVWCFGYNYSAACGADPSVVQVLSPRRVSSAGGVQQLAAAQFHTCAIVDAGVVCWGMAGSGELGATPSGAVPCAGGSTCSETPVFAALRIGAGGAVLPIRALAAGTHHSCLVDAAKAVHCWGDASSGQTGDTRFATTGVADPAAPHAVAGVPAAVAVAIGDRTTCAVAESGTVWCWGANEHGELGRGGSDDAGHPQPAAVAGLAGATSVTVGEGHACAIVGCGRVQCWGRNRAGQLGDGTRDDAPAPVTVQPVP